MGAWKPKLRRGVTNLAGGPLGRAVRGLAAGAVGGMPVSWKGWLITTLVSKHYRGFRRAWIDCHHRPYQLFLPRFDALEVDDMRNRARNRFPDAPRYLLTDMARDRLPLSVEALGARLLDRVADVPAGDGERVFFCLFEDDIALIAALRQVMALPGAFYYTPHTYLPTARYFHRNPLALEVLRDDVVAEPDLDTFDLADYEQILQFIELTRNLEGSYVEIGVYKGRSARLAADYMARAGIERPAWFLDLFEGFSYDAARKSADAFWLGQFQSTSIEAVTARLAPFPNHHVEKTNIITDDLPAGIGPIVLCNIDVDMYEAITSALAKVADRIVPGGVILVEDQGHTPCIAGGCLAVQDFVESAAGKDFVSILLSSGQALLLRRDT